MRASHNPTIIPTPRHQTIILIDAQTSSRSSRYRRVYEAGTLIACHVPLEGRGLTRVDPSHRRPRRHASGPRRSEDSIVMRRAGDQVARRPLAVYDAVARRLAQAEAMVAERGGAA